MSISQLLQTNSYDIKARTVTTDTINADTINGNLTPTSSGIINNVNGTIGLGLIRLTNETTPPSPTYFTNQIYYTVYGNLCFFQAVIHINDVGSNFGNLYYDLADEMPEPLLPLTDPQQVVNLILDKNFADITWKNTWGELTVARQIRFYGFTNAGDKLSMTEASINFDTRINLYGHYFINIEE